MQWNHGPGEIMQSLLDEGMTITGFVEHISIPWCGLSGQMVKQDNGERHVQDRRTRAAERTHRRTGAPDRQSAIAAVIHFASRQRDFIHIRELPGYTAMCNEILGLDAKETDPVATATT